VAKVLLFPADTVTLGPLVSNIATDSWWGPYMPFKSALDGTSATALANDFQAQTGKQWVQSIGGTYALFEIAHQALTSVSDPHNKQEVANAIHNVDYRDGRAAQLHQRPRAGCRRQPRGRRAVEGEHRQVPLRDEGRRQHAEQGGEDRS